MNLGEQGGTQGGDLWARLIHLWTNFPETRWAAHLCDPQSRLNGSPCHLELLQNDAHRSLGMTFILNPPHRPQDTFPHFFPSFQQFSLSVLWTRVIKCFGAFMIQSQIKSNTFVLVHHCRHSDRPGVRTQIHVQAAVWP